MLILGNMKHTESYREIRSFSYFLLDISVFVLYFFLWVSALAKPDTFKNKNSFPHFKRNICSLKSDLRINQGRRGTPTQWPGTQTLELASWALTSCVTLGKLFTFSVSLCSHLRVGIT